MNIAFFLDIPAGLGGAGNLLLQHAVLMLGLHNPIVVIPIGADGHYNTEYAKRCDRYRVPYICLAYKTSFTFSYVDFIAAMDSAADIEKFAVERKIDFFHSVQLNLAVEYVSRKLGIPHLMDIYQIGREEFSLCPGDIYPHYHLCDSLLYSDLWKRQLHIESKCVRPVALMDKVRKKNTYVREIVKILMLGSVCERKNQMEAIRAVEYCMNFGRIELHIAGDMYHGYGDSCEEYVRKQGLQNYVFFYGFVSDIRMLLESSDCLLCSSTDESFPSSIVEALTYDLTIISTPVAGVPELFTDGENGFISKGFSCQDISESILDCLRYYRNGEIRYIHRKAAATWSRHFDREVIKKQINSYYAGIISKNQVSSIAPFHEVDERVREVRLLLEDMDDMGEKWIRGRDLYYAVVRGRMLEGNIYIWGAGKRGKLTFEILRRICLDIRIEAFVDTYKEGAYCGIPVIKVEELPLDKKSFYCISFAVGSDRAIRHLENSGLRLNRQIWYMP